MSLLEKHEHKPCVDVAVLGGGASGMAAAVCAAQNGCRTIIIEAQPKLGRKLLATGNGRCNIANTNTDMKYWHGSELRQIKSVLDSVPLENVLSFLRSLGLSFREEADGRLYPRSEQASSVLDLLRSRLSSLGVEIFCDSKIRSVKKSRDGFKIECQDAEFTAKRVVLALGGKAAPQLGGSGDGCDILASFGHTIRGQAPALMPLKSTAPELKSLKGVRAHCDVSLLDDGETAERESGEVQFTENALSGIAVFQLSAICRTRTCDEISIDLFPELSASRLTKDLYILRKNLPELPAGELLSGMVNKRIAMCLAKKVCSPSTPAKDMTDTQLKKLSALSKDWRFPITDSSDWRQAQVTSGGALLSEFDAGLGSKTVNGLFACGEVLDCAGLCGGFNLRWAWSSGILAGTSAAKSLLK